MRFNYHDTRNYRTLNSLKNQMNLRLINSKFWPTKRRPQLWIHQLMNEATNETQWRKAIYNMYYI